MAGDSVGRQPQRHRGDVSEATLASSGLLGVEDARFGRRIALGRRVCRGPSGHQLDRHMLARYCTTDYARQGHWSCSFKRQTHSHAGRCSCEDDKVP